MASKGIWTTRESAAQCPLMRHLRSLAPVGTRFYIETDMVARRLGFRNVDSTAAELFMLKKMGVLEYSANKGSREVAVRVLV